MNTDTNETRPVAGGTSQSELIKALDLTTNYIEATNDKSPLDTNAGKKFDR